MKKQNILIAAAFLAAYSCKPSEPEVVEVPVEVVEEVMVEEVVWVVDEHHINEMPVTTHPTATPRIKKDPATKAPVRDTTTVHEDVPYTPMPSTEILLAVSTSPDVEPIAPVAGEELIIPLDETQTVQSFGKKGQATGAVQVVTNSTTGEIDHIIFEDKHHKDYYDVQAGMSVKEVKKLRKEMKHMVHKGQVFFYSDDSNIMYLLDVKYSDGTEIVTSDIDESLVTAVVWKDKKHKDHPKHNAKK
ncbi:hypothetical protein [Algoriphagus litoralis]|uniref:hypothetical protein n=1 Tax=Algoriphagus litoralis TaxID=2202829 RepID=UPI000DBA232D|nr:hypothetical protein [Algoriphagus litoralis]